MASGSRDSRCPSCQIRCASIAPTSPGVAATAWVTIAGETSTLWAAVKAAPARA